MPRRVPRRNCRRGGAAPAAGRSLAAGARAPASRPRARGRRAPLFCGEEGSGGGWVDVYLSRRKNLGTCTPQSTASCRLHPRTTKNILTLRNAKREKKPTTFSLCGSKKREASLRFFVPLPRAFQPLPSNPSFPQHLGAPSTVLRGVLRPPTRIARVYLWREARLQSWSAWTSRGCWTSSTTRLAAPRPHVRPRATWWPSVRR